MGFHSGFGHITPLGLNSLAKAYHRYSARLFDQIANRSCEAWSPRTATRFARPIARKRPPMPAEDRVRLPNATTKSTAAGLIAEGGDDVARFVPWRRSDGGESGGWWV